MDAEDFGFGDSPAPGYGGDDSLLNDTGDSQPGDAGKH